MGGSSTSHSAVLRRESGAHKAYDLRSWQGLTDVLRAAKEKLSPTEHASFRDLVLQYAQRGGDAELKAKIDSIIAGLDTPQKRTETPEVVEVVVPKEVITTGPVPVRASVSLMRRSAPRFMPKSVSAHTPSDTLPAPEIKEEPTPQEPEPARSPVVELSPEPIPEPIPLPATPVVSEEVFAAPRSVEEHKARITEIKRLVNEQIGNPVALLGAHKESGKEYMQALLAALKSTGGGGTGIEAAMRRLEDAYSALLTDTPQEQKPVSPAAEILPSVAEEPAIIETAKAEPVVEVPVPVVLKHEPEAVPEVETSASQVSKEEEEAPLPPEPEPVPEPIPVVVAEKKEVPTPVPVSRKIPINFSASATHASVIQEKEKTTPTPTPTPTNPVPSPVLPSSEADGFPQTKYTQKKIGAATIQSLAESGIDADETAVRQSELVSPKITQALHELLHEWSIFASSGLFGTGPSGAEHPLYIKLAHLSMGEIITGRYEGADRQINNVIHDYVNAWRHEQGVAYSPSETFEHFLRRVVQRIQKRTGS